MSTVDQTGLSSGIFARRAGAVPLSSILYPAKGVRIVLLWADWGTGSKPPG